MYISISLSSYLYLLFVIISLSLFTPQNYKIISIPPKSLFNTYIFFPHTFHFGSGERGEGTAMTMQQSVCIMYCTIYSIDINVLVIRLVLGCAVCDLSLGIKFDQLVLVSLIFDENGPIITMRVLQQ